MHCFQRKFGFWVLRQFNRWLEKVVQRFDANGPSSELADDWRPFEGMNIVEQNCVDRRQNTEASELPAKEKTKTKNDIANYYQQKELKQVFDRI